MREEAHLSAMVGFVSEHVAEHFRADRPRLGPGVSAELLDAAARIAEGFSEHFGAASGALRQCDAGLARRAVRAVELTRNLQVRRGEPDPLGADVVHVGEDRGDGADFAGRLGAPSGRGKMFDENLVQAIIGGKDLGRGLAELGVDLLLTHGHVPEVSVICERDCSMRRGLH